MEPTKPAVSLWLWVTLGVVILMAGGFFAWYYLGGSDSETVTDTKTTTSEVATTESETVPTPEPVSTCDLTKVTGLVAGTNWDIQGGENFSTAVCGYLTREDIYNEMDDVTKNIASLVITSYKDAGFKTAIEEGISEGNTVNTSSGGNNKFGLGCYENSQITFNVPNNIGLGSSGTIDAVSTLKLINATATKPVAVKLEFKEHLGSGCNCCNLAEIVEVQ